MPDSTTPPEDISEITTPEQMIAYQEKIARFQATQAAAASAERREKLAPLVEIVNSPGYAALLTDLSRVHLTGAFLAESSIDAHLRAALSVLPALRDATAQP